MVYSGCILFNFDHNDTHHSDNAHTPYTPWKHTICGQSVVCPVHVRSLPFTLLSAAYTKTSSNFSVRLVYIAEKKSLYLLSAYILPPLPPPPSYPPPKLPLVL